MNGRVRRSAYRRPATPEGIRKIESGTLDYFDQEVYGNLNTGFLEQYFDEKNRSESFNRSRFRWSRVLLMIVFVGLPMTLVTQYVALNAGVAIFGTFYIVYLIGMVFKWGPIEINISAGAATAAEKAVSGFVFTFPAIFLLTRSDLYPGPNGAQIISPSLIEGSNILVLAIITAAFGGLLGLMYFIIFRRIWIVEDPLPNPGFQAHYKLLEISEMVSRGKEEYGRRSIKLALWAFIGMMSLKFISIFPVFEVGQGKRNLSILDKLSSVLGSSDWFRGGILNTPYRPSSITTLSVGISGLSFAIGWFLKFRGALMIFLGTMFTWLVIVPLAIYLGVPVYLPSFGGELSGGYVSLDAFRVTGEQAEIIGSPILNLTPVAAAGAYIGQMVALGVILGAGITALIKCTPIFKVVIKDLRSISDIKDRNLLSLNKRYEWPPSHIPIAMLITFTVTFLAFWIIGRFPPITSIIFSASLVAVSIFFGAIAVKIAGETGLIPISAGSIMVLTMLILIFKLIDPVIPFPRGESQLFLMALLGATVFGSTVSLSSDIMWDFKNGLYVGTRPVHLVTGESIGILLGVPAAAVGAYFLSSRILLEDPVHLGPQAKIMASFVQVLYGGKIMISLLILGVMIGVFVELLTGMGAAFGIGMFAPMYITSTLLLGGLSRTIWEEKWLKRRAMINRWTDQQVTLRILDSYMIMIGLFIGETIIGIAHGIYMFIVLK
ncbi:MAG: OPT/YSL family transporter [Thermoplasmatota archaeon]